MRQIIAKADNGHNFQLTKFLVIDFLLNDRRKSFQLQGQTQLAANLPAVDFSSQPREMLLPEPLSV